MTQDFLHTYDNYVDNVLREANPLRFYSAFDLTFSTLTSTIETHPCITASCVLPNDLIAVAHTDHIEVWNIQTEKIVHYVSIPQQVCSLSYVQCSLISALTVGRNKVMLINYEEEEIENIIDFIFNALAFPLKSYLCYAQNPGRQFCVNRLDTWDNVFTLDVENAKSFVVLPNGHMVFDCAYSICVWDIRKKHLIQRTEKIARNEQYDKFVVMKVLDQHTLLTSTGDHQISLWNITNEGVFCYKTKTVECKILGAHSLGGGYVLLYGSNVIVFDYASLRSKKALGRIALNTHILSDGSVVLVNANGYLRTFKVGSSILTRNSNLWKIFLTGQLCDISIRA
jgi:WD40 repeat protein